MAAWALFVMAIAMFAGTLLVGQLPLMLHLSQSKQKALGLYGIGLLIGAALSVVIPEGIETLYDAAPEQSRTVAISLVAGFLFMYIVDELQSHAHKHSDALDPSHDFKERSHHFILARRISVGFDPECNTSRHSRHAPDTDALLPSYISAGSSSPGRRSAPPLERGYSAPPDNASSRPKLDDHLVVHPGKGGSSLSTTIGLLVHSLADGISLGASAALTSASPRGKGVSLDMVVFIAIMVHKAPAAFGLCSVLLGDGWSRNRIRLTLTAFAATAPIGAILTFFFLKLVSSIGGGSEDDALKYWTGVALLFSGGTFLFVATHIMQETDPPIVNEEQQPPARWLKPALMVGGMLTPLFLQAIVGHAH